MNIESRKLALIEQLMQVQDEAIIKLLQDILKQAEKTQYQSDMTPMSVEELEEKLNRAKQDIEEGKTYSTNDVRKHFSNRKDG